jgi:hypothetical protein
VIGERLATRSLTLRYAGANIRNGGGLTHANHTLAHLFESRIFSFLRIVCKAHLLA